MYRRISLYDDVKTTKYKLAKIQIFITCIKLVFFVYIYPT